MKPEDMLAEGARILAEEGHTQEGRFEQDGKYCALGALGKAMGLTVDEELDSFGGTRWMRPAWGDANFREATRRLAVAAGLALSEAGLLGAASYIPDWNDNEASTEGVILAMKRAAHDG